MKTELALDRESLVVAMTVVPGVYSRNKMYRFFEDARVRSARRRAATLRGLCRQLASNAVTEVTVSRSEDGSVVVLTYRLGAVRLARRTELTEVEYAAVAYVAQRGGARALDVTEHERGLVDAALGRLADGLQLSGIEA
jgi:hypothetical protein